MENSSGYPEEFFYSSKVTTSASSMCEKFIKIVDN
jgi:hypothetical protein